MDLDGSGEIEFEEFKTLLSNNGVKDEWGENYKKYSKFKIKNYLALKNKKFFLNVLKKLRKQ